MKLAIISDVHDNIANLKIVLDFLRAKKIKHLICAGDLASQGTSDFLKQNYGGKFYYAFGNAEKDRIDIKKNQNVKNFLIFAESGEFRVDKLKIGVNHFPARAKKMAQSGNYDLVFYGHTHRPWEERISNRTRLINPGNVAGLYYEPTFAVYDTKDVKLELIRIKQLKVESEK